MGDSTSGHFSNMRTLLLILLSSVPLMGQMIQGRVVNTINEESLIFCNISVNGIPVAAIESDGRFRIQLPNDSCVVEFASIGYSTIRVINRSFSRDLGDIYLFWDPTGGFICGPGRRGKLIDRFENGNIRSIVAFNQHGINGVCKKYYPDGRLQIEGRCRKDNPVGDWKYYKTNGEIVTAKFERGIQIVE